MKKIILILTIILFSVAMQAQELTGRTFACNNKEVIFNYFEKQLNSDEEMNDFSAEDKEIFMKFIRLCHIGMELEFKKNNKIEFTFIMSPDNELMKKAGISWGKRKLMNMALKGMASQLSETETYTIQENTIKTQSGDEIIIKEKGKSLIFKEDDFSLQFEAIK